MRVPEDIEFGEYQIAVTGVPKDGSGAMTIYAPLTIKERPKIKVEYDNSLFDESQKMTVTSESPLEIVRVTDQEGTLIEFDSKETGTTFTGYVTLLDPSSGTLTLEAYDRYGLEHSQKIYVSDPEEIRCGWVRGDGLFTWNLEGKDERHEIKITIPPLDEDFLNSLFELPNAQYQNKEGSNTPIAVSPNGEWLLYSNRHSILFSGGSFNDGITFDPSLMLEEDGSLIKSIRVTNFVIYNINTGVNHVLGTRYRKYIVTDNKQSPTEFTHVMRESGKWYYLLKWENSNEAYLLEQTKEDKIFKASQSDLYPSMESNFYESPYASAKIVKLSLNDMSIEETDYIPKREWVSFTDHTTGVIGYTSPKDVQPWGLNTYKELPMLSPDTRQTTLVSTLDGKTVHQLSDLDIPLFENRRIEEYGIRNTGYINDKLYVILSIRYRRTNIETDETGNFEIEFADEIYALEMETGKLTKIVSYDEMCYMDNSVNSSNIDNKIYLCVRSSVITGEPQPRYTAYIGEDLKLHILHEIGQDPYIRYFRKGAWNND